MVRKRIRLNPTINEIKYRIINRLNFNRRSCKRAFTIEIKKSAAIHLKTRYGLTNSFKQYRCFDEYYNVYSLRNFFCNFKYWSIAENSFQIRISKKRKKKYFSENLTKIETVNSDFFNLSFRFMVKSFLI